MTLLLLGAAIAWCVVLVHLRRGLSHIAFLPRAAPRAPGETLPSISVICVVKEEERLVGRTVENLLAVGSPLDEVVVVDDRSSDRTPAILAEIASRDARLRVVRVDELPAGWQGRVHALHVGARHVTGDFLLTVDAEMELRPAVLAQVARCLGQHRLDHLAIVSRLHPKPFALDVLLTTAFVFYAASVRPWLTIEDRPVESVRGVGSFNVVRRSFLARTPGFAALRMEIIDDVGLAQLVASHGGRSQLYFATDEGPSLGWYRSVREMTLRLEKTIVGAFSDYRLSLALWISALSFSCVLLPLAALLALPDPTAITALALFAAATVLWAGTARRQTDRRFLVLLSLPIGIAGMGAILLRSALLCWWRGGILWKGTLYPLADLRAHRRTHFHV